MTASIRLAGARLRACREALAGAERLAYLAILLLYPFVLLWVYRDHISPTYRYIGATWHPPENAWTVVAGVILSILPAIWLPLRLSRPGVLMIWMMYVLVYVPSQVIPIVATDVGAVRLLWLQLALLAGFMIMVMADRVPVLPVPRPTLPPVAFWAGFWIVYLVCTATLVWYLRLPGTLPSFGEVYDVRAVFSDRLVTSPRIVAYIHAWQGTVFNPFLVAYGFARRSYLTAGIGILGQIYLYGTSGEKSVLFIVGLTVAIYLGLRLARSLVLPVIAVGASAIILGSIAIDAVLDTNWFMGLFIHRLTVIPGQLTGVYYEFFSSHPKTLLANSILAPLFDYPYDTSAPDLIGREVFGRPEMTANVNIWGDGYATFGFSGILLVSLIAGAIVWLFNALSTGRRFILGSILAVGVTYIWANASVFTAMLTHGVSLTLVLLWAIPPERNPDASRTRTMDTQ